MNTFAELDNPFNNKEEAIEHFEKRKEDDLLIDENRYSEVLKWYITQDEDALKTIAIESTSTQQKAIANIIEASKKLTSLTMENLFIKIWIEDECFYREVSEKDMYSDVKKTPSGFEYLNYNSVNFDLTKMFYDDFSKILDTKEHNEKKKIHLLKRTFGSPPTTHELHDLIEYLIEYYWKKLEESFDLLNKESIFEHPEPTFITRDFLNNIF